MTLFEMPYRIGNGASRNLPLGRFLPPLAAGVISDWLADHCAPGEWLLDPLGANPALALEAARAGMRVLVCSNNPVLSFMLEVLASSPRPAELQAALADLGAARRGDERLEQHLQALYQTECPGCGALIQPEAFLWRREENAPHARLLACPTCGANGEFPITPPDLDRLAKTGSDGLHRSRALERVAAAGDEDRPAVEEALHSYLPRPLYVLFTLLNRVEGLSAPSERKRLLLALLLGLFDEGNSLWPWPSTRARPRQITIPPQFRENNLWLALEASARDWGSEEPPMPLSRWPDLPPETGGVCLYPGRLKSLLPLPAGVQPVAALAALPRPNQALWTFSAVWSGWLWGREAVQPVKRFFDRRRYDWTWHAGALHSLFSALRQHGPPGLRIFALIPDLNEGFLAAALSSAQSAGLELTGFALRPGASQAQAEWRAASETLVRPAVDMDTLCRDGIRDLLEQTGEPGDYGLLFSAALVSCIHAGGLPGAQPSFPADFLGKIQAAVSRALGDAGFLRRFEGAGQGPESGLWGLAAEEEEDMASPLSDRVETTVHTLLESHPGLPPEELERLVCDRFTGLMTPPTALVSSLLQTLGRAGTDGGPRLDGSGAEAGRQTPAVLRKAAARLGLVAGGEESMTWSTPEGRAVYYLRAPGIGETGAALLAAAPLPAGQCVLVYPERRAAWVLARLQNDPRLSEAVARGWRLLKTEAAAAFADAENVTLTGWEALLNGEPPPGQEARQMPIF